MNQMSLTPHVLLLTVAVGLAGRPAVAAVPQDTVFIVPGSHLDIGFTAPPSEVRAERVRILDLALDAADRDSAFVWFEEGGWSVEVWLDHYHADQERIARLRTLLRAGRFGVGATLLSPYAAAFPEALGLLTMHLQRIEHELGYRPIVGVLNDVPSAPEALVDSLAAAGVRYLLVGPNMSFTAPLPAALVRRPFYWESAGGARLLVFIDPDGFTAGFDLWGLPPACARFFNPERFPADISDDSVLTLGMGAATARLQPDDVLSVVQHALDNWDPECAQELPEAVRRWNAHNSGTHLMLSTPEAYFRRLEAREGSRLPVLRGEWGGNWDVARASEPVWTWRLREAVRALSPGAPHAARLALATVLDHNVGLGPRWVDGLAERDALRHVRDVVELYRTAVAGTLGPAGLTALPPSLPRPQPQPWPASWRALVGEPDQAIHVRAGIGTFQPFVDDSVSVAPIPVEVLADEQRLLARTSLDRALLERVAGPRHKVVIEVGLDVPVDSLRLAMVGSPSTRSGRWLLGSAPEWVVAPEGVLVTGPGFVLRARGPLLYSWRLVRDRANPAMTRLQALAISHAVDGVVSGGPLRWPFATLYPGEPEVVQFELELELLP
ncbi:MAG: hypothetical protein CVT72_15950, partial [Alphaproteobacteria bacterium HGW-Alphaproteobacteria-11]